MAVAVDLFRREFVASGLNGVYRLVGVIARECRPRQGWEEAFQAAGSARHDELLLDKLGPSEFDRKEWEW